MKLLRFTALRLKNHLRGVPPVGERAIEYVGKNATKGDPDSVLAAFDAFARNISFLANVGDIKGKILDKAVTDSGAKRVLEIGAFCGYSAVRIGRLLASTGGHLTSIEASRHYTNIARKAVSIAGLDETVEFLNGKANNLIPTLSGPFDLVFIDHRKDLYLPDLNQLEKHGLLRAGSVVVADNVGVFDLSDYLAHVRDSGLYDSVYHESQMEYRDFTFDAVEISTWRG